MRLDYRERLTQLAQQYGGRSALARSLGVPVRTLSNLTRRKNPVRKSNAEKALGVPVSRVNSRFYRTRPTARLLIPSVERTPVSDASRAIWRDFSFGVRNASDIVLAIRTALDDTPGDWYGTLDSHLRIRDMLGVECRGTGSMRSPLSGEYDFRIDPDRFSKLLLRKPIPDADSFVPVRRSQEEEEPEIEIVGSNPLVEILSAKPYFLTVSVRIGTKPRAQTAN